MNLRFETPFNQVNAQSTSCGTLTVTDPDSGGGEEPSPTPEPPGGGDTGTMDPVPELPGDQTALVAGGVVLALIIVALLVV